MGMSTHWIVLLQLSFAFADGYDTVGFDGWYQPVPHRPVDIIADVINDLGVRILQQYTAHGNVAFSPTGVAFVSAALYEGSAGRGKQQIADALGLPRDRDITRIGFRDIHRRLRTYLNADGFLGGLTLNQENTRLRPEYEDVLRFYGFDLSLVEEEANDTTSTPETPTTTTDSQTPATDEATTPAATPESTDAQASSDDLPATLSTTPPVELLPMTLNTDDSQDRLTQTTPPGATISTTEATDITDSPTTPDSQTVPQNGNADGTTEPTPSTTPTEESSDGQSTDPSSSGVTQPLSESTTSSIINGSIGVTTMAAETTTILSTSASMDAATVNVTQNPTVLTDANPTSEPSADGGPGLTGSGNQTSTSQMGSTDLPGTGEAVTDQSSTLSSPTTDDAMNQVRKRSVRSPRGYFSSYPDEGIWMQDLGIWKPYSPGLSEASVRDSTEISFLVNGCDVSSVTAARYIAVLPFAYFPSLHAVALEFPLDDPRYNILLLMSTDRRDTYRLARDLGGKSLRLLRKQLQATWVRATIPSFMLRGFVTLTSFLQRLGIMDVFEPRAADLSPMTPDLGVYARDVQQSIGVNIRNYMRPDRTHSRNGLFERAGPVPFTAVHPFLYFIVDAETSVALIAGRVNDPLNSRIL